MAAGEHDGGRERTSGSGGGGCTERCGGTDVVDSARQDAERQPAPGQQALHAVAAFSTRLSVVVGDVVLEPDQNEITAALALLKQLPLDGAIVTGDAIFCQRSLCEAITGGGGNCAFVVEANQPEMKAAIAESFGELSPLGVPATRPCRAAA